MAGSKGPRTKVDGTKKRKRDTIDSDTKSKRHRQQTKVNGSNTQTLQRLKQENQGNDGAAGELSSFTPQEVIRPSDDGEAGWRISKPMGGRMLDIDPILTEDEQ
jgi:NET1-associated nuclear protein 1 (U3 small nucleolar RNA-associated protein 17)